MSRALRIVSVCRTLPTPVDPSAGVFVMNRLAAMSRHADVTILQPIPYTPAIKDLPDWARQPSHEAQGCRILHAPMPYLPGILKSADALLLARAIAPFIDRLHAERPVDIIDAHFGYPDGAGCLRVARERAIPCFVTIRGFENEYIHKPGIGPQLRNALRRADGCIPVSHSLRALALSLGVSASRLQVIHNSVEWDIFDPDALQPAQTNLYPEAQPLIVSVGHLIERKRHHVLVEAFAGLLESWPRAGLVIIGGDANEPAYRKRLVSQIASLGLTARVQLAGNLEPRDVAAWLRAADIFALGTAREGCCNAVLEALAVGVPVVTTAVGDNSMFVSHDCNGELVAVDDAAGMRAGMDRALSLRWDRRKIATELRATVGTWDVVGQRAVGFMHERLAA